jgi:hypothetical protein
MTSPDQNVTPESTTNDEEVLAPATPGAEALSLPEDAVDRPSEDG